MVLHRPVELAPSIGKVKGYSNNRGTSLSNEAYRCASYVAGTFCNPCVRVGPLMVLVEPMGFESTSDMETKEFCGATWPSKVLKGKRGKANRDLLCVLPLRLNSVRFGATNELRDCRRAME